MVSAIGAVNGGRWCLKNEEKKKKVVSCSYSSSSANLTEQYRTLRVQPGASEAQVKKAFRRLALQYHPDVCKGSNCSVQFHQINEAYDVVMSNLRREPDPVHQYKSYDQNYGDEGDEPVRGMYDADWDMWEEWMGWEGAGIPDYSSHINPYI